MPARRGSKCACGLAGHSTPTHWSLVSRAFATVGQDLKSLDSCPSCRWSQPDITFIPVLHLGQPLTETVVAALFRLQKPIVTSTQRPTLVSQCDVTSNLISQCVHCPALVPLQPCRLPSSGSTARLPVDLQSLIATATQCPALVSQCVHCPVPAVLPLHLCR